MNVLGIVAEYNPFHNGHKFHIETSKKASGCTHTVCVMSGSLVQRGEFAIFNKWERAKVAILNGADLIIELPAYYTLQSAENFSYGAVSLLDKLGVVNKMSFGSESGDISVLSEAAKVLSGDDEKYNLCFKKLISSGNSYPVSRAKALESIGKFDSDILSPNNLLGIYYLSALHKLNSKIEPIAVKRHLTLHNLVDVKGSFATASYIRNEIKKNGLVSETKKFLPNDYGVQNIFDEKNIEDYILGFFKFNNFDDSTVGAEEGMSAFIASCAKKASNISEFYDLCTTKRYTKSRVRRVCMASLLGINSQCELDYIRVLGFNKKGAELIREINAKSNLPVVVKTADFTPAKNSMFQYDIKATDLAYFSIKERPMGMDYKTSPVSIK